LADARVGAVVQRAVKKDSSLDVGLGQIFGGFGFFSPTTALSMPAGEPLNNREKSVAMGVS
jgi:hypothetical protein